MENEDILKLLTIPKEVQREIIERHLRNIEKFEAITGNRLTKEQRDTALLKLTGDKFEEKARERGYSDDATMEMKFEILLLLVLALDMYDVEI